MEIPDGTYGRLAPRSGLSWENFLSIGGGVVDSDFRGDIEVVIFNHSDKEFEVRRFMSICQIIFEKIEKVVVEEVDSLTQTERGERGFSSGC